MKITRDLLDIDIDVILRYDYIVSQIKKLTRNSIVDLSILEIGGGCYGIAQFIKSKIICCDLSFDATGSKSLDNIVTYEADAQNLPFENNKFRFVVCVDMLEHVAAEKRLKVINELYRVSVDYVFLSVPCGKETAAYEEKYNNRYKKHFGADNKWLKEHIDSGLPEKEEIIDCFSISGAERKNIKVIKQGNLFFWYLQRFFRDILGMGRDINKLYFMLKYMNFGNTYRKIFIVRKTQK